MNNELYKQMVSNRQARLDVLINKRAELRDQLKQLSAEIQCEKLGIRLAKKSMEKN